MNENKRFFVLDLLRGIVVFLMILAHTIYFFHNQTSRLLINLMIFGNTVCFTTFILVSGAVLYIAYLKHDDFYTKQKKFLKRFSILLFSYYILAFLISASGIATTYGFSRWKVIFDILLLRTAPSFTEYIIPSIFFSLFVIIFPEFFKKIAKNIYLAVLVSLSFYFAGYLLYNLSVPPFFEPWKALLSGNNGYFRFPIYQYFPVFILGLSWGQTLTNIAELKKINISKIIFAVLSFGILATFFFALYSGSFEIFARRWPPSLPFISLGLFFAFGVSLLLYYSKQLRKFPILRDLLLVLGQNSFALFWTHVFLLQLYQMAGGTKVWSLTVFFFLFALTLVFSLSLATFIPFNFKFNLTFHKGNHDEQEELIEKDPIYRVGEEIYEEVEKEVGKVESYFSPKSDGTPKKRILIRKRHALGILLILAMAVIFVYPSIVQEKQEKVKSAQVVSWWKDDFTYKSQLSVKNLESFGSIPKGQILQFSFDHQTLAKEKKSKSNGGDVRLVYWDGKKYKDINFWIVNNWGLSNTTLKFETPSDIPSGKEDKGVYLYYGNNIADSLAKDGKQLKGWEYKYKVESLKENQYPVIIKTDRIWNLTDSQFTEKKLNIYVKSEDNFKDAKLTYKILGTKINGDLNPTVNRDSLSGNSWDAEVSLKNLNPGTYQIQAETYQNGEKITSQKEGFYISKPIYVTWTQDWEGYDVSDAYLKAMSRLSSEHGLKMTHLFNPRIYTGLPKERQDFLTGWVKERNIKNNEEIGLHIHMFYDFIKDAGVEPKNSPNWGDNGDGYGALTSNYSEEEMTKILNKAFWWFEQKGLGKPVSYRAGGWFANIETLKALENVGIKIDSSGRTPYDFGTNKVKGFWDLSETTQPYKPSVNDQNTSSSDNLNIWEIPDNGADSYWFKTDEMIGRFNQNYKGGILLDKKQITYLSHPHWFNPAEQERVDKTFDYIDGFKYENDLGPAVYVTLNDIYKDWLEKEK